MIPENSIVYLETSAINYMTDYLPVADARATRDYHAAKGTKFVVSSVAISEILLTGDEIRREKLIYHLQHLADRILISSPAELVFRYIEAGCPKVEPKHDLISRLPFAEVYTDVIDNAAKTFIFNKEDVAATSKGVLEAFKYIKSIVGFPGVQTAEEKEAHERQHALEQLLMQMKMVDYKQLTAEEKKQYKLSAMLMHILICVGIGLEQEFVNQYWIKRGVKTDAERFIHLFINHESLIYQGPFVVMADTILSQLKQGGKPTRGIVWDAMHAIYIIYSDLFMTDDGHFKQLFEDHLQLPYIRVLYLREVEIFKVDPASKSNSESKT